MVVTVGMVAILTYSYIGQKCAFWHYFIGKTEITDVAASNSVSKMCSPL